MLRRNFGEVFPNFHAFRVCTQGINFYLIDLVDDVARFAHDRENGKPNDQYIPDRFRGFFDFADIFFEDHGE